MARYNYEPEPEVEVVEVSVEGEDYEAFEEYRDHGRVLSTEERAVERQQERERRAR